ncbi:MAG TPA: PAS domain-containing sensor histidine kinase, partial [Methanocella sp.]|nr:PAS domain-containing sensor histidine kinase [Methanocella sp.]
QSTLISNLPGMVYRRREDDDMTMEFVSEGCADLTGYNPDDLISGPITYTSLIHPEDKNRVRSEIRQALREDQAFRLRYRITSADASEKWVYEQGRAITCTVDGQSVIEGFVSDITEQMRAEEAVEVAKAQAELYLELICHDINNMNQRGMGFIDVAMNSPDLHQDQMKLLSCTLQALQDSSELISNVAKLQLIHSCGISRGIVDIGSLLKELIPLYTSMPGRNISIIYVPVSGCYVIANELVRDVFSNILGNSLKHSSGDLEIVICLDSVYLNNTKYSRISFEDNGPGIDDPMKSRLFKRFERGDTRASGKGLGLYLVRMLVEEFQGIVWVEDRISGDPGNGCRFVVLLPAAEKPGLENN